jgi:regulator of replication initiation timing
VSDETCRKEVQQIVSMTADLAMERNQMVTIEEQIKDFMIENATRRTEREKLIELLPEMVKSGQAGKPT